LLELDVLGSWLLITDDASDVGVGVKFVVGVGVGAGALFKLSI
jgi:hypothetical protein